MAKTISFNLSEDSVSQAITELKQYKSDIAKKTLLYQQKVAERLKDYVTAGFLGATSDSYTVYVGETGISRTEHGAVSVSVTHSGNLSIVAALGADAVWIEFGTGVTNNPSPHPDSSLTTPTMTIGSYGKGNGNKKQWGFIDENGQLCISKGIQMSMPMANAMTMIYSDLSSIAREVFG